MGNIKRNTVKIIKGFAGAVIIILLTTCTSFGAGGVFNSYDSNELGVYLFGDSKHTETTLNYGVDLSNSSTQSLGLGFSLKYPVSLLSLSLFPLVNLEYQNVFNSLGTDSNLLWVNLGGGLDYSINESSYIRGEFLYSPVMFRITSDNLRYNLNPGFSVRIGYGWYPSLSFLKKPSQTGGSSSGGSSTGGSSSGGSSTGGSSSGGTSSGGSTSSGETRDGWDIRSLDTARSANYLSDLEKDIILEINMVRTNPKRYAEMYINPGKSSDARAAYNELTRAANLTALQPRRGLSQAAKDHVLDTGPKGIVGHTGSDRSTFDQRMNRYGTWSGSISENCSYGMNTARSINIQLLESTGHRRNIMNGNSRVVGVATGPHSQYRFMCVQKFAAGYTDR